MSINENPRHIVPVEDYTHAKGKLVAEQFADGETLRNLAAAYPEMLPAAMYIKAWRKENPQFNEIMKMAEAALADVMIQDAEDVAGNIEIPAAHGANKIKVKLARAAALDSQVYGNKRIIGGDKENPLTIKVVRDLSNAELMVIARGGVVEALPPGNENEKLPGGRGEPPLVAVDGEAEYSVRGIREPATGVEEPSVTTRLGTEKSGVVKKGMDVGF